MEQQADKQALAGSMPTNTEQPSNGPGAVSIHLVRIPDKLQRERAFQALLDTGESWVTVAGNVLGLSSRQVKALEAQGVQFEWVSKMVAHG